MLHQNIVVRGLVRNNSQFLLVRKQSDNETDTGLYEFPGGEVGFGESAEAVLSRIIFDVTGYKITTFKLSNVYSYVQHESHIIGICYDVTVNDDRFMSAMPKNTNYEYLWVTISDIDKSQISEEAAIVVEGSTNIIVVNNTDTLSEVKLYTDGGSRGNPGPSALGYVVVDMNDNVVTKGSKYLGITTNNQAEYQAVKAGLQYCAENKYSHVSVYLDSQLVANQMNGIYKIKNRDLWPIHESIKQLVLQFSDGVQFTFIPREYNIDADEMVNSELDKFESNTR